MRQFVMTLGAANTAAKAYADLLEGEVGIYNMVNGQYVPLAANVPVNSGVIVQRRLVIGDKVIPFSTNDFSSEKMVYQAATTFSATIDLAQFTTVTFPGEATILIVKKGVPLNMRYEYINTTHVFNTASIPAALQALLNAINSKADVSGVTATLAGTTFTLTGTTPGDDYEIVLGDLLTPYMTGITLTPAKSAMADWVMVKDLSRRAAADDGFEYTYYENFAQMYPGYPIERASSDSVMGVQEFTIYSLRYAEPRRMKTVDRLVHQIVQIACINGGAFATGMDALIGLIRGVETGTSAQVTTPAP
jgi:hypothetical protein